MSSIHTREDVIALFKKADASIKDDAADTFLDFVHKVDCSEEDLELYVETERINKKIACFNYKLIIQLIDSIKREISVNEPSGNSYSAQRKRQISYMSAPSTPLKKVHQNSNEPSLLMATPATGHMMDINSSPSLRHNESPKTWPTPGKSELFRNRKDKNSIKVAYSELDSTICDETVTNPIHNGSTPTIDRFVGEQNISSRFAKIDENFDTIREMIIKSREKMNRIYNKGFTSISYETETEVSVCGMVYFDSASSTILRDSLIYLYDENESKISLLLSEVPKFALFPGQIIGVEGIMNNRRIQVKLLYPGYQVLPREVPIDIISEEGFNIVVARGPFTSRDYEQFIEFISVLKETKPDALILCGPIIPETSANTLSFCSSSFYSSPMWNSFKKLEIPTVIIPSIDDATAFPVFPQPPYDVKSNQIGIQMAGNPSMISFGNNVLIGVVNTDILMDLMKNSYLKQDRGIDKQDLFCSQLVEQQSMYPLYPSNNIPLDLSRLNLLSWSEIPDIQIIATDKMSFVKNVNGTLFIAPGPLALGNGGGTYARVTIYPFKKDYIDSQREAGKNAITNSVVNRCKVDIVKL